MKYLRASSLLRLTLLAMLAVLVPPSVALVTATVATQRLARTNAETVLVAAEIVDLARALSEHATAMERHARQRAVLDDPAYGELYDGRRADFLATAGKLEALGLPEALDGRLSALLASEASLNAALEAHPSDHPVHRDALVELATLSDDARGVLSEASVAIGRAAQGMQHDAAALQQRLVRQGVLAVPLLLVLLIVMGLLIVRPLRTLDEAIRLLGAGELERPVQVRGPADVRELGERLEWLRQRLLALESDRIRLFRHVSHELKTPLTCIREGSQLLSDGVVGPLSEEQSEIVGILRENTVQLHRRIEDLLRISELRQQGATLDLGPVALDEVVRQVLAQNAVAARARDVRLAPRLTSVELVADAHKLRTVVDNLVTNALKFSPEGSTLRLSLASGPREILLVVEDEGPGFAPAERDRVFEAFYQGQATWIGHVSGTGLGLTIAREYVQAHGGVLQIGEGRDGARVEVRLPVTGERAR